MIFPTYSITYIEKIISSGDFFGGGIAVHFVVSEGSMIAPGFLLLIGEWIALDFLSMNPQIVWTISVVYWYFPSGWINQIASNFLLNCVTL